LLLAFFRKESSKKNHNSGKVEGKCDSKIPLISCWDFWASFSKESSPEWESRRTVANFSFRLFDDLSNPVSLFVGSLCA